MRPLHRITLLAILIVLSVTTGCARLTPVVYKGYSGEARPDTAVAIVRAAKVYEKAGIYEIDGKQVVHEDPDKYYSEARLLPGPHSVSLYRWFLVSVLIVPKGYIEAVSQPFLVTMEAGHVYELHADRTTGPGFRVYFWIEDATTGKVVAGHKL